MYHSFCSPISKLHSLPTIRLRSVSAPFLPDFPSPSPTTVTHTLLKKSKEGGRWENHECARFCHFINHTSYALARPTSNCVIWKRCRTHSSRNHRHPITTLYAKEDGRISCHLLLASREIQRTYAFHANTYQCNTSQHLVTLVSIFMHCLEALISTTRHQDAPTNPSLLFFSRSHCLSFTDSLFFSSSSWNSASWTIAAIESPPFVDLDLSKKK